MAAPLVEEDLVASGAELEVEDAGFDVAALVVVMAGVVRVAVRALEDELAVAAVAVLDVEEERLGLRHSLSAANVTIEWLREW